MMPTNYIMDALKEEIGFDWDEPFAVKMGDIRRLVEVQGFRLNFVLHFLRRSTPLLFVPKGDEVDDMVVAEFSHGWSEAYYRERAGAWPIRSLLEVTMIAMVQKGPISIIEYNMGMCRSVYKIYGYTFDECYRLYRQLERDGFMEVLKKPDNSLRDDEIIAIMTKDITQEYYDRNEKQWML